MYTYCQLLQYEEHIPLSLFLFVHSFLYYTILLYPLFGKPHHLSLRPFTLILFSFPFVCDTPFSIRFHDYFQIGSCHSMGFVFFLDNKSGVFFEMGRSPVKNRIISDCNCNNAIFFLLLHYKSLHYRKEKKKSAF